MYYCKCPFETEKWFVIVHNTGMPSPAINEVSYMIRNGNEVSFHDAVDEKEIVRGIPHTRNAWASGDGHGDGNMHGIHIEICRSMSEDLGLFAQAERNAAEYIASILRDHAWGIDRVKKHQDFDGKYCPHRTLEWGWKRFLNLVQSYLNEDVVKEEEEVTYEQWLDFYHRYERERAESPTADWAKEGWDNVCKAKLFDGTRPNSYATRQEIAVVLDRIEKTAEEE